MATKKKNKSEIYRTQSDDYLIVYDKTDRMYGLVAELSGYGLLDNEIAKLFGLDYRRFAEMKAADDDLKVALDIGKARATASVTKALYSKCVGYQFDEITETVVTDESDGSSKHTISTKSKHVPPSDNAIIFWLSNRTESWKQSQKISVGRGSDDIDLNSMDEKQLSEYIQQMKSKLIGVKQTDDVNEQG